MAINLKFLKFSKNIYLIRDERLQIKSSVLHLTYVFFRNPEQPFKLNTIFFKFFKDDIFGIIINFYGR